jgi:transketolase
MSLSSDELSRLQEKAVSIRQLIVKMMGADKPHHFGGSLSAVEIVTALYFYKMRYDPTNPGWPDRDRFIMSKGHAVPTQYAALALLGVFPIDELKTLKRMGTRLQGHPVMHLTPGVEACGGALGEGLSYANGIALARNILGMSFHIYCLLGDGELQEGQIWEAAMTASKHELKNLIAIVDQNGLKAMDRTRDSKRMDPMAERWRTFGWCAIEIDGHDLSALCNALDWATEHSKQPVVIIANTVKGKGISFIESQAQYHNAPLSEEQVQLALKELV